MDSAVSEPALHGLLTFLVPTLMSLFRCLDRTKQSVQVRQVFMFRKKASFYGDDLLAHSPTPKLEEQPLSADRDCLFNIFAATLHN
jgi:hypothetical protein